jgi:hypothetical protein
MRSLSRIRIQRNTGTEVPLFAESEKIYGSYSDKKILRINSIVRINFAYV